MAIAKKVPKFETLTVHLGVQDAENRRKARRFTPAKMLRMTMAAAWWNWMKLTWIGVCHQSVKDLGMFYSLERIFGDLGDM